MKKFLYILVAGFAIVAMLAMPANASQWVTLFEDTFEWTSGVGPWSLAMSNPPTSTFETLPNGSCPFFNASGRCLHLMSQGGTSGDVGLVDFSPASDWAFSTSFRLKVDTHGSDGKEIALLTGNGAAGTAFQLNIRTVNGQAQIRQECESSLGTVYGTWLDLPNRWWFETETANILLDYIADDFAPHCDLTVGNLGWPFVETTSTLSPYNNAPFLVETTELGIGVINNPSGQLDVYVDDFSESRGIEGTPTPTFTPGPSPTPNPGRIFGDGFETADFGAWSSATVTGENYMASVLASQCPEGVLVDNRCMTADVDTAGGSAYVGDTSPAANVATYFAEFKAQVSTTAPSTNPMRTMFGYAADGTKAFVLQVYDIASNPNYKARLGCFNNSGTASYTAWLTIPTRGTTQYGTARFQIQYLAATSGSCQLALRDLDSSSMPYAQIFLNNSAKKIDRVEFGIPSIPTGYWGAIYADDFNSSSNGTICPPCADRPE